MKPTDNLFPAFDASEILDRVDQAWDLSGRLPLPRWNVKCACCDAKRSDNALQFRHWRFHQRKTGGYAYRCDVSAKCTVCSHVMVFGVAVTESMFNAAKKQSLYTWREAKAILEAGN